MQASHVMCDSHRFDRCDVASKVAFLVILQGVKEWREALPFSMQEPCVYRHPTQHLSCTMTISNFWVLAVYHSLIATQRFIAFLWRACSNVASPCGHEVVSSIANHLVTLVFHRSRLNEPSRFVSSPCKGKRGTACWNVQAEEDHSSEAVQFV